MAQNIIEYARELSIKQLFSTKGFDKVWPTWKKYINDKYLSDPVSPQQLFNLGDYLRDIFKTTGKSGRSQSDISGGGSNWEALVCWYLNLCTIGRRTFVIKHNKKLLPDAVNKAITVNYGNFRSNTESDLIAITFPEDSNYEIDKNDIVVNDSNGIEVINNTKKGYNFLPVINALIEHDFENIEIHIIQCKTNWNDNAQIPMLWDAIYSAENFRNGISVGCDGYSIHDVSRFTYSFVTVPSNQIEKNGKKQYKNNSTAVLRVINLSGGNYWGLKSESGVASSIKELVERNLKGGSAKGILASLKDNSFKLNTDYKYFNII